jgi:ABC-type bacteriocin/lantibiotic exporter with double-glycine peptidase domain
MVLPTPVQRRFPPTERLFFFLPAVMLLTGACAAVLPSGDRGPDRLVPGVPFFAQEMHQCGPASLAGVLNYWGIPVSPEEIARSLYSPGARGTLNMDLVFYGEKKGLKALQYSGSEEDLEKNISEKIPLVVLVDEGFLAYRKHHFMVVVGYNDGGIFANSGGKQKRFYAWPDFLRTWEKTKHWTLRLTPQ